MKSFSRPTLAILASFVPTVFAANPSSTEVRAAAETVRQQATAPVNAVRDQASAQTAAVRDQVKDKLKSPAKLPKLDVPNLAQAAKTRRASVDEKNARLAHVRDFKALSGALWQHLDERDTVGVAVMDARDHRAAPGEIVHDVVLPHRPRRVERRRRKAAHERLQFLPARLAGQRDPHDVIADVDVVIDGADNFPTRYLLSDACVKHAKPMVYGAVHRFEGQVSVFAAGRRRGEAPCYRCLFPEAPSAQEAPNCAEAGVLGVLPGIIGLLQATEALKLILGLGDSLAGRLLHFDALAMRFRETRLRPDPDCAVCALDRDFPGYEQAADWCGDAQ